MPYSASASPRRSFKRAARLDLLLVELASVISVAQPVGDAGRGARAHRPAARDGRGSAAARAPARVARDPPAGIRASARTATAPIPAAGPRLPRRSRLPTRWRHAGCRDPARVGPASRPCRPPSRCPAQPSASVANSSAWRPRSSSRPPRAVPCSSANSRIVSSIPKRGSPPIPSDCRTRLFSTSDPSASSTSPATSLPQTCSMASSPRAADEDRQAREQRPLRLVEHVVAPGDRAAQRLLPFGKVAGAAGEQPEAVLEPAQHRLRA